MSGFIGRSSCIGIPPSLTIFAFFLCKRRSWFFFILAICSSSLRDMMTIIQKMKCRREIHTSSSRAYPCQHHLSAQDYPLTSVPLQWPGDCACRHEWRQHLWQFRYSIVRRSRLMILSQVRWYYTTNPQISWCARLCDHYLAQNFLHGRDRRRLLGQTWEKFALTHQPRLYREFKTCLILDMKALSTFFVSLFIRDC